MALTSASSFCNRLSTVASRDFTAATHLSGLPCVNAATAVKKAINQLIRGEYILSQYKPQSCSEQYDSIILTAPRKCRRWFPRANKSGKISRFYALEPFRFLFSLLNWKIFELFYAESGVFILLLVNLYYCLCRIFQGHERTSVLYWSRECLHH